MFSVRRSRVLRGLAWTLATAAVGYLCLAGGGLGAQVRPLYSRGAAGLVQILQRLPIVASALHTGAHPDDEDSALMARLARGDHVRVAYLALTRGDGGQNVIGPELFEGLGVIRTEELLQARRLDGGDQLFTRAFDFGFSKSREETARKWGEELILGDIVRAIRMYRPLVVISRFTGTAADGHGHHRFAGYLTPKAVHMAGDPSRFPEQMEEGLRPWEPLKLYVSEGLRPDPSRPASLRLETGELNPVFGRSYFEIAMEGRSQHKSQEMGMLELRGPHSSGLRLLESHVSTPSEETGLFDGIDTSLSGLPVLVGLPEGLVNAALDRVQQQAEEALARFNALEPERVIPPLAEGLRALREARQRVEEDSSVDEKSRYDAEFLLGLKEGEFMKALRLAAGVELDALAEAETVVPGGKTRVELRVFFPHGSPVEVKKAELRTPSGWRVETAGPRQEARAGRFRFLRERGRFEAFFELAVADDAPWTQPYWLDTPRKGDVYDWRRGDPMGKPFGPPIVQALVTMDIGGARVVATRPVEYRTADPARGELRRELNVVPALSVALSSGLLVVPTASVPRTKRIVVRVENQREEATSGHAELELPAGWKASPAAAAFELERKGESTAPSFTVETPGSTPAGTYTIGVRAVSGGRSYHQQMHTIAYPHIQTHRFYTPAETTVQVLDLAVADVRVGYIMGSGDRVPAAIQRMGVDVTLLDAEDLATGDLSRFDTIVVGIRASQVRPDFVANNTRVLDFVRRGGCLIVQYQRRDYVSRGLTPYPAKMARPEHFSNYRITDETAAMHLLEPEHPVFNTPNRIRAEDWDGWVQERSLYHLTDLDPRYVPLIEAADPGEEPHPGGLVYAEVGKGRYVYAGLSFFRQLPAGVPGAYRLFANLISLPKAP